MVEHHCQVFVGNIPHDTEKEDLQHLFRDCPKINHFLIRDHFAFVNFDSIQDAEEAVKKAYGRRLLGRRVRIEVAMKSSSRIVQGPRTPSPPRAIYSGPVSKFTLEVQNLSSQTSWQDLKDVISKCRTPLYVTAHKYEKYKGTMDFESIEDMHAVLKKFQNYELHGRKIKLVFANPSLQIPPLPGPSKVPDSSLKKRSRSISPNQNNRNRSLKRRAESRHPSKSPTQTYTSTTICDKPDEERKQSERIPVKENKVETEQGAYQVFENLSNHQESTTSEGQNPDSPSKNRRSPSRVSRSCSKNRRSRVSRSCSKSRRSQPRASRSCSKIPQSRLRASRSASKHSLRNHTPTEENHDYSPSIPSIGDVSTLSPSDEEGQYHSPPKQKSRSRSGDRDTERQIEKRSSSSSVEKKSSREEPRDKSRSRSVSKERERDRGKTPLRNREKRRSSSMEKSRSKSNKKSKESNRSKSKDSSRSRLKERKRSNSEARTLLKTSRRLYYFVGGSRSRSRSSSKSSNAGLGEKILKKQLKETKEIVQMLYPNSSSRSRSRERNRLRSRRIYYFDDPSYSKSKLKSRSRSRGPKRSSRAKLTLPDEEKKSEESAPSDETKKHKRVPELHPSDPRSHSSRNSYWSTKESWVNCPSSSPAQHSLSLQLHETNNESVGSDVNAVSPSTLKRCRSKSKSRCRSKSKSRCRSKSKSRRRSKSKSRRRSRSKSRLHRSRSGPKDRSRSRSKSRARFNRFRSESRFRASQERNHDKPRRSMERKQDKTTKFLIDPSSKKPRSITYRINLSGTD